MKRIKCRHPRAAVWGGFCADGFKVCECLDCPERKKIKVGRQFHKGDDSREITCVNFADSKLQWGNLSSTHCERHWQGIESFLNWAAERPLNDDIGVAHERYTIETN